jgi:O-antigen/teichoic acid export membrane protein
MSDGSPATRDSKRSMARSALHLMVGQVSMTAISIVISSAIGRSLGASDYGILYLANSIAGFAFVLVDWGQTPYVVREVARHPETAGEMLGSALTFRVGMTVVVAVISFAVVALLGYDLRIRGYTTLVIVLGLPYLLAATFTLIFRAHERMDLYATVDVSNKLLTLVLVVPAVLLGGRVLAVVVNQGLAGVGALVVGVYLYRKLRLPPIRATAATRRALLVGGSPMLAMALAVSLQPYIDAVLLSKLAPAVAVGWYAAAQNFINVLNAPATILGSAAYPRLSRARGDPEKFRIELRTALRPVVVVGALGMVGTYLFAGMVVSIVFGAEKFGPSIQILQAFAPGLLLLFIDIVLANALLALHRARALAMAKFVAVALGAGLNYVLIPWTQARFGNGGIGVVLSFSLAEIVMIVASLMLIPKGTLERGLLRDIGKALLAGAATLGGVLLLPTRSPFVQLPACLLLFAALSFAFRLVTTEDLLTLRLALRRE